MPPSESTYRSYLLRLWHAGAPGAPLRAMLEPVAEPGRRHYFRDLETLTAFLAAQQAPADEAKGGRDTEPSSDPPPGHTA